MKKSLIVQTVITGIAILLIVAFGVYALLISNNNRTSININVADENLDFQFQGSAGWSTGSFITQTGPNGLVNKVWNLPDLNLTTQNLSSPQRLDLRINNLNRHPEYNIRITISGLAYDTYGLDSRLFTYVGCEVDGHELLLHEAINEENPTFEIVIPGEAQLIEIYVAYYLGQAGASFNISQDITVTFNSEDPSL